MLNYVQAQSMANEGLTFKRPGQDDSDLSPEKLDLLTDLVVTRFIEQVAWDDVTNVYIGGLVTERDLALVQQAVKARAKELIQ